VTDDLQNLAMPSAAILAYDGINPEAVEVWRRRAEDSDDPADDASYERARAALEERNSRLPDTRQANPSDFDEEVVEAELDRLRRIREARAQASAEHYRAVVERRRAELEHAEAKLATYESQAEDGG
jgi:gamma-glutamylcysteine synthetase